MEEAIKVLEAQYKLSRNKSQWYHGFRNAICKLQHYRCHTDTNNDRKDALLLRAYEYIKADQTQNTLGRQGLKDAIKLEIGIA